MALDFLAGCVGGCAGLLASHPFDTIKVRLQTQDVKNPMYKGAMDCFKKIVQKESISGLYKGLASPLAGVAVVNAILFGTQANLLRLSTERDAMYFIGMCGAVSGLTQAFVASPMEMVKTRLQIQGQCKGWSHFMHLSHKPNEFSGPLDCFSHIAKTSGLKGICSGLGMTISRDVPAFAIYFSSYEFLYRKFARNGNGGGLMAPIMAGGLAGVTSWILTYPLDVIKSRLQSGTYEYEGVRHCIRHTYEEGGYRLFFSGLSPTLLRAFPNNAITFLVVASIIKHIPANQSDVTTLECVSSSATGDCVAETKRVQTRPSEPERKIGTFGNIVIFINDKFSDIGRLLRASIPQVAAQDKLPYDYSKDDTFIWDHGKLC